MRGYGGGGGWREGDANKILQLTSFREREKKYQPILFDLLCPWKMEMG
jgi:hypothetical protein